MKTKIALFFILIVTFSNAQKSCEYSSNVKDSLGTYKATKDYIVQEKIFGGKESRIYFSLENVDGMPNLKIQTIQKSMDFIQTNCFNKDSKVYFQLSNGKIVTLIHVNQENCGTMVRDEKGFNNRINTGYFMFLKNTFEILKSSPITLMRIKYSTETQDFVFKSELISEIDSKTYYPDTYFIEYLKCIE
ncbi:MAG: hypothetical protein H7239_06205 [Flavobacterium sp.]|nr:hypothetical protein [Flavobacterium sp.]